MELRHLRYFVAVAEELHFGRAADRLFMAQPPLSQQIKQLETEIGAQLFERTNRRVALSDAGVAFLADARVILDRVDQATVRARQIGRGEAGWFGVGFAGSATYDVLPAILRTFRERLPSVELVLHELTWTEQAKALQERRIHVGFARLPQAQEGLVLEMVAREPLIVAAPTAHPFADRDFVPLADVAGEPFLLYPPRRESGYARYIIDLCLEAGFTPRVVQEVGELQTAISLVAAGIGITLVPASVQDLKREGVAYRPLAEPAPTIALTLAYREAETSPLLGRFLEIARAGSARAA